MALGRIYVGNLPWEIKKKHLFEYFGVIGDVVKVDMIINEKTGRFAGYAFITMENPEEAIELCNGRELVGRELSVNWARGGRVEEPV